jgi:hypothetical protein
MLGTLGKEMGRKKKGKESPGRDDKAVKFDRTLADKAAFVCARRHLTMAEYLSEMCRSRIERDFLKETTGQQGGES